MPSSNYELIRDGLASVQTGQTVVSGEAIEWTRLRSGDRFGAHVGLAVPIKSVVGSQITLAYPWPGPSQTEAAYAIEPKSDTDYFTKTVRELLQILSEHDVIEDLDTVSEAVTNHVASKANPHAVTLAQVGTGYFFPESYGAKGGNPMFDDFAGIQGAVNAALAAGGGTIYLHPERVYYIGQKLVIDPSRITIMGNSAQLDFRLKSFTDPATVTQLVNNPEFNGQTGWSNSGNTSNTITYGAGTVSAPAAAGTTIGRYSEFGQRLVMQAGKTYRIKMKVVSITPITVSINTARTINVSLRNNGIGNGGSGGTGRVASNQDNEYATSKVWEWEIVSPYENPYLTIASNCGFEIDSIEVKELPDNALILIRVPENGQLRGHNYHCMSNIKIRGKAGTSGYSDGIVFDTPTPGFHSRINFYNIDLSENIGRGLIFQNRAYLMNFYSCRIVCAQACVDTLENPLDAGENIAFFGGNMGGGKLGIRNRGMAIRLYSTSIDFSRQFYVGTGDIEIHGGWLESNQKSAAEAATPEFADTQYFFDITGGTFKMFGGYIQIDGSTDNPAEAIFRLGAVAKVDLEKVNVYNLHSSSGLIAVGPGRINASLRGGVNKEMEPVLSRNASVVRGGFDDSVLSVNTWVTSASKQRQPDRRTVQWYTTRTFTGTLTRGTNVIAVPVTTGLNSGYEVTGEGIPPGTTIISISTNVSITLSQNVNLNGERTMVGFASTPYAAASVGLSTEQARSGTGSLKFTKAGIGATSLGCLIAYPIPPGRATGGELFIKVPAIPGSPSVQSAFVDAYFAAIGPDDASGLPAVSDIRQSITSQNIPITFANGIDWTRVSWKSTRVDASSAHDGYAPDWATHVVISINAASLPNGFAIYIDDLVANVY